MNELERMARPGDGSDSVNDCPFKTADEILRLPFRQYPHWHILLTGRHIGVHRADERVCNWTARVLLSNGRYKQRCLGPALDLGKGALSFEAAISRAFEWFETGGIKALSSVTKYRGRVRELSVCPIGEIYTVGHALRDYLKWSKIARSQGTHYNNLTLMNYHLVPSVSSIPVEEFRAEDLQNLAIRVLETPPKRGFEEPPAKVCIESLSAEEARTRKRTFNSLVTILRMAFKYAWENGRLESERSWKCLNRVSVNHSPRRIFLTRAECRTLIDCCAPALQKLVLAGLYTGCRVGELGALLVKDVAKDGFGITIRAFKRSPTRFVFLPEEGMAFFLDCCEGKSPEDHVLLSAKGRPWKKQHGLHFRTAVAKAGLPKDFVFHGLRHTYASDLLKGGASLDTIAKQLGHANTRTVINTYGHMAERFREDEVRSCFAPLSADNQELANRVKERLNRVLQDERTIDWRDVAAFSPETSLPRSSVARPHALLLQTFGRIPGRH